MLQTHRTAQLGSDGQRNVHTAGWPSLTSFWPWTAKPTGSYRTHGYTRLLHQEATSSGHMAHQAPFTPTLTKTGLPKSSSMQSTQSPLFQDWERELFYLTHRNIHTESNKMGRQKICPKLRNKEKHQKTEQNKNSNEMEISSLPDKEFKGD